MLPGNIFGLILKNKMGAKVYSTLNKDYCWPSRAKGIIGRDLKFAGYVPHYKIFCWPSRAKGIIGRDLKFAGYVPHYKILTGNIFGLIMKNKRRVPVNGHCVS